MFEMIKDHMSKSVPYAAHTGVALKEITAGEATAELAQTENSINHIGSQHAGALFTLGEASSGAAMSGAFAPVILEVRPVAANAEIAYKKIAKGVITAKGRLSGSADELMQELEAAGKVAFDVNVSLTDENEDEVATMTVAWHLHKS